MTNSDFSRLAIGTRVKYSAGIGENHTEGTGTVVAKEVNVILGDLDITVRGKNFTTFANGNLVASQSEIELF